MKLRRVATSSNIPSDVSDELIDGYERILFVISSLSRAFVWIGGGDDVSVIDSVFGEALICNWELVFDLEAIFNMQSLYDGGNKDGVGCFFVVVGRGGERSIFMVREDWWE